MVRILDFVRRLPEVWSDTKKPSELPPPPRKEPETKQERRLASITQEVRLEYEQWKLTNVLPWYECPMDSPLYKYGHFVEHEQPGRSSIIAQLISAAIERCQQLAQDGNLSREDIQSEFELLRPIRLLGVDVSSMFVQQLQSELKASRHGATRHAVDINGLPLRKKFSYERFLEPSVSIRLEMSIEQRGNIAKFNSAISRCLHLAAEARLSKCFIQNEFTRLGNDLGVTFVRSLQRKLAQFFPSQSQEGLCINIHELPNYLPGLRRENATEGFIVKNCSLDE